MRYFSSWIQLHGGYSGKEYHWCLDVSRVLVWMCSVGAGPESDSEPPGQNLEEDKILMDDQSMKATERSPSGWESGKNYQDRISWQSNFACPISKELSQGKNCWHWFEGFRAWDLAGNTLRVLVRVEWNYQAEQEEFGEFLWKLRSLYFHLFFLRKEP